MSFPWGEQGGVLAGRYRLLEQVGAGGMAVVWRANDLVLASQALPFVRPDRWRTSCRYRWFQDLHSAICKRNANESTAQ